MELNRVLDIVLGGVMLGGIYGLVSLGLNLQYGVARVLNVAHGEFATLGAFLTWWLYVRAGMSPFVGLAAALGLSFGLGWALYRLVFARLQRLVRSLEAFEAACMLTSFGILFVIQNVVILAWGADVRSYSYLPGAVRLGELVLPVNRIIIFGVSVGLGGLFYALLKRTRIGKAIRAAAQDRSGAASVGVDVQNVLGICFALGTGAAGAAGSLISMVYSIHPIMGFEYTVIAIIVVVLGGLGNIPGSLLGGVLLGVVGTAVTYWQPGLAVVAYYFLFVVLLWWRPKGLLAA
ncbi:MAG: branched-chain amino acid ABC transporter permease [Armatimonadota bacterium]|nr:branched-chain amino acid ABC transporter permease [Armatimonadota bacterium]MDR7569611.1 branched-chain amino acid ABC transporter permease [Armatimonadota bacterium]MDR7614665.1 branched-chain amino acid ABC transporter permease [Armatimonadota bacterium]